MTHLYRWTTTRYGPLADRLQGRLNEQCRVITRGRNVGGMAVSRYPVGADSTDEFTLAPLMPYPSKSPRRSWIPGAVSNTSRASRRGFLLLPGGRKE